MTQPISAQRVLKGTYAQRVERERQMRVWRVVKLWADRIVTAAIFVCAAYALWAILGRGI